ncbi:siroheme decarboxylase subunit beta [Tichowtungia aerotolerans]|uniref:siroheme decarboxylase n=1 Tax=Tichowtungia aerotolerans TaxID=2697043 RepID=A0A6P1M3C1_9BACT|nr:hypothetical protein [Tichowtungia aerotolerans]QHI68602.1 hypothetical protein GT409_03770 [Tichowtungia aerotolerans]
MRIAVENRILTQLQRGVELVSRPFQTLEIPEAKVLALLHEAQSDGLLRRFGGIFDARHLGYKSILCALDVPDELLEEKAAIISNHLGVTHCYERLPVGDGDYPNLWFTLAMLEDEFNSGFAKLREELGLELSQLPAIRRFKIDVVFDLAPHGRDETGSGSPVPSDAVSCCGFSEREKVLVRAMDQQMPLVERPFSTVAEQIGESEEFVLTTLQAWKEQGVLRRIGAILYHREAGFKNNAMCVWPVPEDEILSAGQRVAARSEVTHCYQRPRLDAFPFNLYAMIHTANQEETLELFKDISSACGLSGGELFASGREFKKTSMQYFREE